MGIKLTSPSFKNGESIPSKYTCDGKNISPPLKISDVPEGTKSLALVMDDPDIPDFAKERFKVEVWDHWIIWNIPPETKEISEGKNPAGILGVNTRGNLAYGGPCPPDKEHRYFFKLYALDIMLNLKQGSTKKELEKAMESHIINKTELIGKYNRITS